MIDLDSLKAGLNVPQWEAVSHPGGPLLVLAGAGSGKTRVLTCRIAYLIGAMNVDPWEILALTFTNKAAREMRGRMEKLLAHDAPGLWIGTFHSICLRILRSHPDVLPVGSDFTVYDADDQKRLAKFTAEALGFNTKKANVLLHLVQQLKNRGITPSGFEKTARFERERNLLAFYREYQGRLYEANALDFGDLLLEVASMFEAEPEIADYYRRRFKHVLIDEYQDTNHVQFMLARELTRLHQNLCAVGDDDQSIYSWRGADVGNILSFEHEFPDAKIVKLEQNYRSTEVILEAASAIAGKNPSRHEKKLWTEKTGGAPVVVHEAPTEEEEAAWLARTVQRLRSQGADYSDMAILYRVHALSRPIEEAFISRDIPYQMFGGLRFYARMEIKDALAFLRLVFNPEDIVSFQRIVNKPTRGIGAATIQAVEEVARDEGLGLSKALMLSAREGVLGARRAKAVARFIDMLEDWRSLAKTLSLAELLEHILKSSGYIESLNSLGDEMQVETRRENLVELLNAASEIDNSRPEDVLRFLDRTALATDQDAAGGQIDAVSLMTLHAAKGLEFPVVFIAGMEDGTFPHHMSRDEEDGVEEERRLCYVGFTRAMDRLYLTRSRVRRLYGVKGIYRDPSQFLYDLAEKRNAFSQTPINPYQTGHYQAEPYQTGIDVGVVPAGQAEAGVESGSESGWEDDREADDRRYFIPEPGQGEYKKGMNVRHEKYGTGVITAVEGWGPRLKIVVRFDVAGERKLLAHMSNIEIAMD